MSTNSNPDPHATRFPGPRVQPKTQKGVLLKLPGLIAISLYMLLLAVLTALGVASGRVHPLFLVFAVLLIAGALGLLLLLRWAWALTLAAVALSAGSFLWSSTTQHNSGSLVQGVLNLVFFLYLVRTDVRKRLR